MMLVLLVSLLLTGCVSAFERSYTDICVITQPDKQGGGYTTGTFPCRLQHTTVQEKQVP